MHCLGRPLPYRSRPRSTILRPPRKRERPGGNPVFQNIGADGAERKLLRRSLAGRWTDSNPAAALCAPHSCANSIASTPLTDAGDGVQPQHRPPHPRCRRCWRHRERRPLRRDLGSRAMSHVAIAAALALENVSAGERLAAFSLASFANREHRAWPGTRVAAARAGLSRSQYLAARGGLEKRGLVAVEESGVGRGHSPVVAVQFAQQDRGVRQRSTHRCSRRRSATAARKGPRGCCWRRWRRSPTTSLR